MRHGVAGVSGASCVRCVRCVLYVRFARFDGVSVVSGVSSLDCVSGVFENTIRPVNKCFETDWGRFENYKLAGLMQN
jgi:hypothetical protein